MLYRNLGLNETIVILIYSRPVSSFVPRKGYAAFVTVDIQAQLTVVKLPTVVTSNTATVF